jgi:transcriptional regulator with XRE-family HTH domain
MVFLQYLFSIYQKIPRKTSRQQRKRRLTPDFKNFMFIKFLYRKILCKHKDFHPKHHSIAGFLYIVYMETATFWSRTKQLIKAHKISQKRFAEYIGVPVATLWAWIHYDRVPDVLTACDIAAALGVTVEYLVWGTDGAAAEDRMRRTAERKTAAAKIAVLIRQLEDEAGRIG